MIEKNSPASTSLSLRDYGFMVAMIVLGISIGLLLYPALDFPAIWQFAAAGLSIILMALTAPALRKRER